MRRARNVISAFDFARSIAVGVFLVANENFVSGASDTRVTDGAASPAAISRIALSARGQSGNR